MVLHTLTKDLSTQQDLTNSLDMEDNFHGNFSQLGRGQHGRSSCEGNNEPQCQLCGRKGHVVMQWYYRFD